MRLSTSQLQLLEDRAYARAMTDGLDAFEADTRETDPVLADQIATYRDHGDRSIFSRIVELTDVGDYQRGLLGRRQRNIRTQAKARLEAFVLSKPPMGYLGEKTFRASDPSGGKRYDVDSYGTTNNFIA